MEILLGLCGATLLIYGWAKGSVLVSIFLTLGGLFGMAILGLFRTGNPTLVWTAVIMPAVIWAPIVIRSQPARARPSSVVILPGSLPFNVNFRTPEERAEKIASLVCMILFFGAIKWVFFHDLPNVLNMVTGRPFLTMVGFAALWGLAMGWANREPKAR